MSSESSGGSAVSEQTAATKRPCEPPPGPRQAVVLIHGIGEQRPMETLRDFVAALLPEGRQCANSGRANRPEEPRQTYYSKPDTLSDQSDQYELRRLKLRRICVSKDASENVNADWPETDFYEYYWAHQMYGTTISHVVSWLIRTLARGWRVLKEPVGEFERLRRLAIGAWAVTVAIGTLSVVGTVVAWVLTSRPEVRAAWPLLGALGAALYIFGKTLAYLRVVFLGQLLDVIGDVARYLDVAPRNIARRYDILRGGIALLRHLHEARDERGGEILYRYGRVIVVGHSLGSVIAYDILRHYWSEVNGRISVEHMDLGQVESFYPEGSPPPRPDLETHSCTKTFRDDQARAWCTVADRVPSGCALDKRRLWREVSGRAGKLCVLEPPDDWRPARWLVSDLITVGSPLSYAPMLLTEGLQGKDGLWNKIRLRELPTCPPDRSRSHNPGHFTVDLSVEADGFDDYPILHHAAHFALTRWSNFWYPRDWISGPLRPSFGLGIQDQKLADVSRWPIRSHTGYWNKSDAECTNAMRAILKSSPRIAQGE